MRVSVAGLADAASIREGLLNVLGFGVTSIFVPHLPIAANVVLPLVLEATAADMEEQHTLTVDVRLPDGEVTEFGRVVLDAMESNVNDGRLPVNLIQVLPFNAFPLRDPGLHQVEITVDEAAPVVVPFVVQLVDMQDT